MSASRSYLVASGTDWSDSWQAAQEIAVRLARMGHRVAYVENPPTRAPKLSDAARIGSRLRRWTSSAGGAAKPSKHGVAVISPLLLPPSDDAITRAVNRRILAPRLLASVTAALGPTFAMWTFVSSQSIADFVDAAGARMQGLVYYASIDVSQAANGRAWSEAERRILGRTDAVFCNCRPLATRMAMLHPAASVVPPGVDLDLFPLERPTGEPAMYTDRRRPVIGYLGSLHHHLDYPLLHALALARPSWTFVYVGPHAASARQGIASLASLPNVVMTEQVPHDEVARHVRAFDVCTMPFVQTAYTLTVAPTKLNEYLALGKPVVSTHLPAVLAEPDQASVVTFAPNDPAGFLDAIERSLPRADRGEQEQAIARRRQVAEAASWEKRLSAMLERASQRNSYFK